VLIRSKFNFFSPAKSGDFAELAKKVVLNYEFLRSLTFSYAP